MIAISERQRASFYIYKKQKIAKRFYIQKARHFSKSKTIYVTFYIQKERYFTSQKFHEIFEFGMYIQEA